MSEEQDKFASIWWSLQMWACTLFGRTRRTTKLAWRQVNNTRVWNWTGCKPRTRTESARHSGLWTDCKWSDVFCGQWQTTTAFAVRTNECTTSPLGLGRNRLVSSILYGPKWIVCFVTNKQRKTIIFGGQSSLDRSRLIRLAGIGPKSRRSTEDARISSSDKQHHKIMWSKKPVPFWLKSSRQIQNKHWTGE